MKKVELYDIRDYVNKSGIYEEIFEKKENCILISIPQSMRLICRTTKDRITSGRNTAPPSDFIQLPAAQHPKVPHLKAFLRW